MSEIEQMIQSKGLTAPRVTPADIESRIVGEYCFTADKAVEGALHAEPLKLLTLCVLVLENGFTVVGKSACASPENFDAQVGRKVARENAVREIWALEGYLLRQRLHEASVTG